MTFYQTKTTVFEAIQWTCDNYEDVKTFTDGNVALSANNACVIINGLTVCDTDWILKFTSQGSTTKQFGTRTNLMFTENYETYQGLL